MAALAIVLRLLAVVVFAVGGLHLTLGVEADVLLGADLRTEAISDPVLDSQSRFFGVMFTLSGVLLVLCATDIPRYALVLRCVLLVFFTGGVARLVSIAVHGLPPPQVVALLVVELVVPPALAWWSSRAVRPIASPEQISHAHREGAS
ncbi:MAG: DUF4345 domain-containing protein [Phycicoccus sp.]